MSIKNITKLTLPSIQEKEGGLFCSFSLKEVMEALGWECLKQGQAAPTTNL